MLDIIDKELLKTLTGSESVPRGAVNIRKNGQFISKHTTENIDIVTNDELHGIDVIIKPGTVNESVYIPVILNTGDLMDVVYNRFILGENSDITIIAGCGIHSGSDAPQGHVNVHEFKLEKNARLRYLEKHHATGPGRGKRTLTPTTKMFMEQDSRAELELLQTGGMDMTKRITEALLGPASLLSVTERVITSGEEEAASRYTIILEGSDSRCEITSQALIMGDSNQDFYASMEAQAKSYGRFECEAIIMDNGTCEAIPALRSFHPHADLGHRGAIGRSADRQLHELMDTGMGHDEATDTIKKNFWNRQ